MFYIYTQDGSTKRRWDGTTQGLQLSMIMTSIQRPAPPTRYHTYAIINTGLECMMFLRGLIHAFPPDFFPPLLHCINDYRVAGEKIIEHTIIESV